MFCVSAIHPMALWSSAYSHAALDVKFNTRDEAEVFMEQAKQSHPELMWWSITEEGESNEDC